MLTSTYFFNFKNTSNTNISNFFTQILFHKILIDSNDNNTLTMILVLLIITSTNVVYTDIYNFLLHLSLLLHSIHFILFFFPNNFTFYLKDSWQFYFVFSFFFFCAFIFHFIFLAFIYFSFSI